MKKSKTKKHQAGKLLSLPNEPKTFRIMAGTTLYRIHETQYGAEYYGTNFSGRYGIKGTKAGVMYMGENPEAAFVEVYQKYLTASPRVIPQYALANRSLSSITINETINPIWFSAEGMALNGVNSQITQGLHAEAQKWSQCIFDHKDRFPGIWYACNHNNDFGALVLYQGRCNITVKDWGCTMDREDIQDFIEKYNLTVKA